jgi:hypothetical protein
MDKGCTCIHQLSMAELSSIQRLAIVCTYSVSILCTGIQELFASRNLCSRCYDNEHKYVHNVQPNYFAAKPFCYWVKMFKYVCRHEHEKQTKKSFDVCLPSMKTLFETRHKGGFTHTWRLNTEYLSTHMIHTWVYYEKNRCMFILQTQTFYVINLKHSVLWCVHWRL